MQQLNNMGLISMQRQCKEFYTFSPSKPVCV